MRHNYPVRRTDFLSQYWLKIGYLAWRGYLNSDRGLVVISSEIDLLDNTAVIDRDLPAADLNFRYTDFSGRILPPSRYRLVPAAQTLAARLLRPNAEAIE